jgi:hypothetical protein
LVGLHYQPLTFETVTQFEKTLTIDTETFEEGQVVVSRGTGPVPALSAQARYTTDSRFWVEAEADGFYASNAFINGAEYPFTGWIRDAALSAGAPVTRYAEGYLSLCTIRGGDERYTKNELTTVAVSVGVRLLFSARRPGSGSSVETRHLSLE